MTTTSNTLTISKVGYTSVSVLLATPEPVKHRFDKLVIPINVPKQTTPYTIIIDLKRLAETITFKGFLLDEAGNSMWTKRDNLRTMLQQSGDFYIVWDANDPQQSGAHSAGYQCDIQTCEISENPYGVGDSEDTKAFAITIQFIVGQTRG